MIRDGQISIVLKISGNAEKFWKVPEERVPSKIYWSRPPYISITRLILGRYQLSDATHGYSVVTEGRLAPTISKNWRAKPKKRFIVVVISVHVHEM